MSELICCIQVVRGPPAGWRRVRSCETPAHGSNDTDRAAEARTESTRRATWPNRRNALSISNKKLTKRSVVCTKVSEWRKSSPRCRKLGSLCTTFGLYVLFRTIDGRYDESGEQCAWSSAAASYATTVSLTVL